MIQFYYFSLPFVWSCHMHLYSFVKSICIVLLHPFVQFYHSLIISICLVSSSIYKLIILTSICSLFISFSTDFSYPFAQFCHIEFYSLVISICIVLSHPFVQSYYVYLYSLVTSIWIVLSHLFGQSFHIHLYSFVKST